jgi:AraC-like DNA-binding protein
MKVALADLLQSIRIAAVDSAFVELSASGGVRFAGEQQVFLYLMLSGTATLEVAGPHPPMALAQGEYAVVFGNRPHTLIAGSDCSIVKSDYFAARHGHDAPPTIRFGRGRLASVLLTCAFQLRATHPLVRALPRHIAMTAATSTHLLRLDGDDIGRCARGPGASTFVTSLTDMLFMQAVRSAVHELFTGDSPPSSMLDSFRIPIALSLIHSHPERPWSLARLAQEINMSRSSFAAEFMASVGEPPMRYITRLRMARAADLLRWQPITVSDVAWQVGYQSVASFTRAFKQYHGVTPTAFQGAKAPRRAEGLAGQMHWAPFIAEGSEL